MDDPLISVLIPAYNRADTIVECIRSALDSTYRHLQIIVADNGSTDGTPALVQRLAEQDARIQVILHANNCGPLPNWRSCLERATGDLVHWLWSDDWVEPQFYATLVAAMQHQQASVAVSGVRMRWSDGRSQSAHHLKATDADPLRLLQLGLDGFHLPQSPAAFLLPRPGLERHFHDALPVIGTIDCNKRAIGCDALMILGCLQNATRVAVIEQPLVNFRAHANSISISQGHVLGAHYAWARLWWSRQQRLSRWRNSFDVLRLLRRGSLRPIVRGLIRG